MRFFTVAVAALSATIAVAHPTILKTVAECEAAYDFCRSGDNPDRNFSACASEHASCLAAAAAAAATTGKFTNETIHYTTQVVTAYTTYCPVPTTISHGNKTYTVTEATTLTITDCPCTITSPATPVPTAPAPGKSECEAMYDFCRSGDNPDRNMSLCESQYAACKAGASPSSGVAHPTSGMLPSPTGSRPQFTGAASSMKPACGFLALGALAFL
jgi:hypothetical protein